MWAKNVKMWLKDPPINNWWVEPAILGLPRNHRGNREFTTPFRNGLVHPQVKKKNRRHSVVITCGESPSMDGNPWEHPGLLQGGFRWCLLIQGEIYQKTLCVHPMFPLKKTWWDMNYLHISWEFMRFFTRHPLVKLPFTNALSHCFRKAPIPRRFSMMPPSVKAWEDHLEQHFSRDTRL